MNKKLTLLFSCLMLLAASVFSQTPSVPSQEQVFYVQCNDLNFDKYSALHNRLKNDGRYVIATACIPAHILTIKVIQPSSLNQTVDVNFQNFRELAVSSEIQFTELLLNCNTQIFENQCLSARSGN